MSLRLSVIIPVLNEATIIESALENFPWQQGVEVLIVDGGSEDGTVELCRQYPCILLQSPQTGRAWQMNWGAAAAQGEILLFLHLDGQLPQEYVDIIENTLNRNQAIAGAFRFQVAFSGWRYRILEWLVNWRSRYWQLPYGDQGLFIRREQFVQTCGFPEIPLLEDYEWVKRLQAVGNIKIAPVPVISSGRRWQKLGLLRTTWINQRVLWGYRQGIAPETLADCYYLRR